MEDWRGKVFSMFLQSIYSVIHMCYTVIVHRRVDVTTQPADYVRSYINAQTFLSRFFMYTDTSIKKENRSVNDWNFPIVAYMAMGQAWPSQFKLESCIHVYKRTCVYNTCKVTLINVCARVQAAVAAVNLSGGAWIEYVP